MHASESAALLDSLMVGLSNPSDSTLRNQVGYGVDDYQAIEVCERRGEETRRDERGREKRRREETRGQETRREERREER